MKIAPNIVGKAFADSVSEAVLHARRQSCTSSIFEGRKSLLITMQGIMLVAA